MAKGSNQKLKLMYLAKILLRDTDENHGLTMPSIQAKLRGYGIGADRKTLYSDIEELQRFGLDVKGEQTENGYLYRVVARDFELPELKLLVDSVQAAKFITEKKSQELIAKLGTLCSSFAADQLSRQVHLEGRVKAMNESVYYNVDKIHTAINTNVQIRFQYFQWNVRKEQELRHDGKWYVVSPWCLVCDDSYYYLVAYDAKCESLKHYRVDKMLHIHLTKEERDGAELFSETDVAAYSKSLTGMFGGEDVPVTLVAENQFAGVLIDRFGRDIILAREDEDHFRTVVKVVPSDLFLSWVMSFRGGIRVVGPDSVQESLRQMIADLQKTFS